MPVSVMVAVEGITDEAVASRLVRYAGAEPAAVYGKRGKTNLKQQLRGYLNAARHQPWFILVDLDRDADCAPPLCQAWLPQPPPRLCLRVAVRAIEAWLMADAEQLAKFLAVRKSAIPSQPESVENPKEVMVDLARKSRIREIQQDMVPHEGSGRRIGPAYASRLIEFAQEKWRPEVAAARADSLARAIRALSKLVEESHDP